MHNLEQDYERRVCVNIIISTVFTKPLVSTANSSNLF